MSRDISLQRMGIPTLHNITPYNDAGSNIQHLNLFGVVTGNAPRKQTSMALSIHAYKRQVSTFETASCFSFLLFNHMGGMIMLLQLERESNLTLTENGALTNRSTGSHCLNFFATCGALRNTETNILIRLFARAYAENRNLAMRTLFYARDIRGGLGERRLFQEIISWLARNRPHSARKSIDLIPEYGRWDDLLPLLGTPIEADVVTLIRNQLSMDLEAMQAGRTVSLLGKWLPSVNTSSALRKTQARLLCKRLGMTEKAYRQYLSQLRTHIDILEKRIRVRDYTFDYSKQPSGAMHKYRKAFLRNDRTRYTEYTRKVIDGEAQMHAGTLFPYQIVHSCLQAGDKSPKLIQSLDASWKSLPDYGGSRNALAVIDGSASMFWGGNPLPAEIALSLGIYFAERNTGYFKDHFITFSHSPRLVKLEGDNIVDRTMYCMSFNECSNTNLRATFELILKAAMKNKLSQEDLPDALYIISDMEFDMGTNYDATLFEEIRQLYTENGYQLPQLVYWNVDCRNEQYPVTKDENGTILVSGSSPMLFKMVAGQYASPEAFMLSVLNSERYRSISA